MSYQDITARYKTTYCPFKSISKDDISVLSSETSHNHLVIRGRIKSPNTERCRINLASLYMIIDKTDYAAYIHIDHNEKYYFLPNFSDYVILLADNKPVPKLLISSYPKNAYKKANSRNCYISRASDFIEVIGDDYNEAKIFYDIDKKDKYLDISQLNEDNIKKLILNAIKRYTRYI